MSLWLPDSRHVQHVKLCVENFIASTRKRIGHGIIFQLARLGLQNPKPEHSLDASKLLCMLPQRRSRERQRRSALFINVHLRGC